MRFKRLATILYGATLASLSVEILVRRWVWDQIPTPVPMRLVYALLLVNATVLARMTGFRFSREPGRKSVSEARAFADNVTAEPGEDESTLPERIIAEAGSPDPRRNGEAGQKP